MTLTVALLANPLAGRGRGGRLAGPVRAALAAAGLDVLVLAGESGPHSTELAAEAVAGGVQAVVAVGGDGLVHCAVQALAGTRVPLGIVPAGGGNDLAGTLGLPADPAAAVAAIAAGRTRTIDLGRTLPTGAAGAAVDPVAGTGPDGAAGPAAGVGSPGGTGPAGGAAAGGPGTDGGRWWATVLCAGFDSTVAERAERIRWPRGPRRYDLAILAELSRLRPRTFRLTLDGRTVELDAALVAVGNGTRYGGGMVICPGAELDDGLLDVFVGGVVTRRQLIVLSRQVRTGRHVGHPSASLFRAREVTVEAPDLRVYADGERLGLLPVATTCVPAALRVFAP